ncbi:MAG: DNA methyltransferase [bacterium]|nr:DNA methyltransferase [bacterium]
MNKAALRLDADIAEILVQSIQSKKPVQGYTHEYYRYPARFSPEFVKSVIEAFSKPGETVLDPFMGGGTTLVEAIVSGRHAIGTDINPLAVFLAKVKTTPLQRKDLVVVQKWASALSSKLNLHSTPTRSHKIHDKYYQKDLPWPIRKTIELILARTKKLNTARQQNFARCVLLKTAQWAVDSNRTIPTAAKFRQSFLKNVDEMSAGMSTFVEALREAGKPKCLCLNQSAIGIDKAPIIKRHTPNPKLVITSPPYPGVHILYHRWQVKGRRETPAPYWIINSSDGKMESFYTFGARSQKNMTYYFSQVQEAFSSIRAIMDEEGLVVQMIGFSNYNHQLPRYLDAMTAAGFREVTLKELTGRYAKRVWRDVPNRKWYSHLKGRISASKEIALFHSPS